MAIDPDKVLAAPPSVVPSGWDVDDVILYHLGLGAGVPPTDPGELAYVLEPDPKVLPTFGVIPASAASVVATKVDGLEFGSTLVLHGEHEIVVHRPLPASAPGATSSGRVVAVHDKGRSAVAVVQVDTSTEAGELLCSNRYSLFLKGAGGFGGDPGPAAEPFEPVGEPDAVIEVPTLPQQALIYRLSGDRNRLHADPGYAAKAGFERPILHGLCTWGTTCKAITDHLLDGDVTAVAGWSARFTGVVFPGEVLEVRCWRQGGTILATASVPERDAVVLSNGRRQVAGGA
jgi:acyl dehydratase